MVEKGNVIQKEKKGRKNERKKKKETKTTQNNKREEKKERIRKFQKKIPNPNYKIPKKKSQNWKYGLPKNDKST